MENFFTDIQDFFLNENYLYWLVGTIIIYPALLIIFNELIFRFKNKNDNFISILRNVQYYIIPSFIVMSMLTSLYGVSEENVLFKVTKTIFWFSIIYTSVTLINVIVFDSRTFSIKELKIPKLLIDFARLFLILIGVAIMLSTVWNIDLGQLLTALGVGSIVLGLALQDTLSGVFSGLALLSGKQFKIGDWLKINDIEGKIEGMDWRSVSLRTRGQDLVIIPNTVLAKNIFSNYTMPTTKHMQKVTFDISFDDAPTQVKEVLLEVAESTEDILKDPAPMVAVLSYDEFSVKYEICYFINDYEKKPRIRDNFVAAVWYAARRDGFTFPTRAHKLYFGENEDTNDNDNSKIIEVLRQLRLFEYNASVFEQIANHCKHYEYGEGEEIIKQNAICQGLYIVIEGVAEEFFIDTHHIKHKITTFQRGQFFGLTSMFCDQPHPTSVYAITDITIIKLLPEAIKIIFDNNPALLHEFDQMIEGQKRKVEKINLGK